MKSFFKVMILVMGCLLITGSASAQWTLFTVEEGAVPNGTTYPTLAQAIATAETYLGGPHQIMIKAGDYYGTDFAPNSAKISDIYGDPDAAVEDIVFHGGSDFMTLSSNMTIAHITVTGYDDAFTDAGVVITNTVIDDVVMDGNAIGVLLTGGSKPWTGSNSTADVYVTNCMFLDNTAYGVQIGMNAGCGPGIFVNDNCFVGNAVNAYESNTDCIQTFDHNYWDDDVAGATTYAITAGGGGEVDANPWRHENLADGPAEGDFGTIVRVYFNWTIPACADVQDLAAYDFTAHWNAAKVTYVPGSFWPTNEGFLGPDDTQGGDAVYTFDGNDAASGQLHFAGANFTTPAEGEGTLAYADFEVIDALTSVAFYTTSDYRNGDNDPIPVPGGTPTYFILPLVDNTAPVMDPIDVLASNYPDNKYSKGSTAGPGPFVDLEFSGLHCTDNYELAGVEWSIDDATWFPWYGTGVVDDHTDAGPREFNIAAGSTFPVPFEGLATIYISAVDAASNRSVSQPYEILIDRSCTTPTLELADKGCAFFDGYTADETIGYTLAGFDTDVVDMKHIDINGFHTYTTEPFVAADDYLMDATAEVVHLIRFYLYDDVGNQSALVQEPMRLDKTAPVPVGPLVINGGDAKTGDENVTITLTSWGGSDMIILTETGANDPCVPGDWTNRYGNPWPMPYVLDPVADGLHTVEFFGADSAGNVSAVALEDDITLDTKAPEVTSVLVEDMDAGTLPHVAGGEDCTDEWDVNVTIYFDDSDADAVYVRIDHGAGSFLYGNGVDIITSPVTYVYDMDHEGAGPTPSGQEITVNVKVFDDSTPRNIGTGSDPIWLDYANPPMTTAVVSDLNAPAEGSPVYSVYTNELDVDIEMTGLTDDVVEIGVSEDGGTIWTYFDVSGDMPASPYNITYTFMGTPTECAYEYLDIVALDCSGNPSAVITDGIIFDFQLPDITAFSGPTTTAGLTVTLSITATDDCAPLLPYYIRITEEGSAATPAWITWAAWIGDPTFDLEDKSLLATPESNDGDRTLKLECADRAGNVTATSAIIKDGETVDDIVITVDMSEPMLAGDVWVVSDNPLAMIDYTDSRTAGYNAFFFTPDPADGVTEIFIYNNDYSWNTGWVDAVSPIDLGLLTPSGDGDKTIRYYYRDVVFNQSVEFTHIVHFDNDPAPVPTNATAQQGGSAILAWDDMDVQYYHIRSNFAGGYPEYADVVALGPPPHPATFMEGIFVAEPVDPTHTFNGPQPDLYAISIWSLSKAGVWSTGPNVEILANDYAKGDVSDAAGEYGPDGCIDFDPEFVFLAASYWTSFGDVAFDPYMDIGPTNDGTQDGYSLPDGNIDFEDLVLFALNYRDFRCSKKGATGSDRGTDQQSVVTSVIADVTISAEVPAFARAGDEFSVPFSISEGGIAGYHLVFDYPDNVEVVSVDPGSAYENTDRMFFYHDEDATNLDISSVVLSEGFEAGEIAVVTFRATSTGMINLEDKVLDVRDWQNGKAEVTFDLAAKGGTLPTEFSLSQNYPNPFNPTTTVELAMPVAGQYKLTIYNIIGQIVSSFEGYSDAGFVTFNWDASEQSSGVYLYRVEAGSFSDVRKMVLLK